MGNLSGIEVDLHVLEFIQESICSNLRMWGKEGIPETGELDRMVDGFNFTMLRTRESIRQTQACLERRWHDVFQPALTGLLANRPAA